MKKNATLIAYLALLISLLTLGLFMSYKLDIFMSSSSDEENATIISNENYTYRYAGTINGESAYRVFQDNSGNLLLYSREYQQNNFDINQNAMPIETMIRYAPLEKGEITTYRGYRKFCNEIRIESELSDDYPYYLVIFYGSSYSKCNFDLVDVVVDKINKSVKIFARKKESEITGVGTGTLVVIPLDIEDEEGWRIWMEKCYSEDDLDEIKAKYGI